MPTTDEHTARAREYALGKAVEFFGSQDNGAPVMLPRTVREQARELVEASEIFYRWLCVGLRMDLLTITASAPYRPGGAATPLPEGSTMANPQVPVSYQFDLTVAPEDVLGNPVSDTLTWTNSDTTGATTLTVDDATTRWPTSPPRSASPRRRRSRRRPPDRSGRKPRPSAGAFVCARQSSSGSSMPAGAARGR